MAILTEQDTEEAQAPIFFPIYFIRGDSISETGWIEIYE